MDSVRGDSPGKNTRVGCHALLQGCAEYIMWNAGQNETQLGIKTAGSKTNNLRYTEDITLMTEREEELENALMRVKVKSEKAGSKLNIQKNKITAASPIISWHIVLVL